MLFEIISTFAAHLEACHDWHLPNPAPKNTNRQKMRILVTTPPLTHKTDSFISFINYGSPACPHSSTAIVPWTTPVATPPEVPGRSHRFGSGVRWWRSPGKLCQHLRAPRYTKPTWCPVHVSFLPAKVVDTRCKKSLQLEGSIPVHVGVKNDAWWLSQHIQYCGRYRSDTRKMPLVSKDLCKITTWKNLKHGHSDSQHSHLHRSVALYSGSFLELCCAARWYQTKKVFCWPCMVYP